MMPADPEKAEYWSSEWQRLHIDKQGRLYRPCEWLSQSRDFVLDRRIKCRPDDLSIADARQPVLKWPKVNGAARYQGSFMSDKHNQDWFNIDQTQFVIGGGITSGEWRYWMVAALDASGKTLARREGRFYGHGTDAALIARLRAEAAVCAPDPPQGQPYLGFQPIGSQVPKDPATPLSRISGSVPPATGEPVAGQAGGGVAPPAGGPPPSPSSHKNNLTSGHPSTR